MRKQETTSADARQSVISIAGDYQSLYIDNTLKGKYTAETGWDPCTGLGTPDGAKLMTGLGG